MKSLLVGLLLGGGAWLIYRNFSVRQSVATTPNPASPTAADQLSFVDLDTLPMRKRLANVLDIARGVALPGEVVEY